MNELLHKTLSKICPIESTVTPLELEHRTKEFPSFCFRFFRPMVKELVNLMETVESYKESKWKITFTKKNFCLELKEKDFENVKNSEILELKVFNFCKYIEKKMNIENAFPKKYDESMLMNAIDIKDKYKLEDFWEPGMYQVFLVKDIPYSFKDFSFGEKDIELSFGLAYREWIEILFENFFQGDKIDLGIRNSIIKNESLFSLTSDLDNYPLFSKIKDYSKDTAYSLQEIPLLREECSRLFLKSKSLQSKRGLDKLLRICYWAEHSSLNIYLVGV